MRREIDKSAERQRVTVRLRLVFLEVSKARKLTPYALAQGAGLTLPAVLFILRDKNGFKADTVDRFAIAFEVFASELYAIAEWREGLHARPPKLAGRLHLSGVARTSGRNRRRKRG